MPRAETVQEVAVFVLRVGAIPLVASQGRSALFAVAAYCMLSVAYHLAVLMLGCWAVLRHDRKLQAGRAPILPPLTAT